ncbi:MAG: YcaO-like family protein [Bacteroidales bacterium]|nr:YcaO-like family protein [Bacteroidales bacterium]
MGIYTKDAIKEIKPGETVQKCNEIFEKYDFKSITNTLAILEERQEKFGVYTGTFSLNPYGLFELFPDKFPYLEGKDYVNFQISNGKGLSFEQCQASLLVEMFERLSIKLHEQKVKDKKEEFGKLYSGDDYYSYLKEEAAYLHDHFTSKKFGYKLHENEADYLKIEDVKDNNSVYFPAYVLFDTMGTNGFTAGNSKEEAISGGVFEIVERHTQTLFCLDEIDASRITLPSIVSEIPELENIIQKCNDFFDKYDVVDVSITLNGIKFYSYFVRTEYDITGHKTFSSGGCHVDQRIAMIRAISESIQSFSENIEDAKKTTTRQQGWGAYRLFTNYFIKRVYGKIGNLPEVALQINKITFNSIHEIYEKSIAAFDHVLVLDCTNEHFQIPTYIIYIPELFPKTYLWSALFHVGTSMFKETLIPENIEGIERLFFWDIDMLDNKEEIERKEAYLKTISKLYNKEINSFIKEQYPQYKQDELLQKVERVTFYDDDDPDSFIFFSKNTDVDYLFESYARIGCLSLCKPLIGKLSNHDLFSTYINKYDSLGEYLLENEEYERALVVYDQLVEVSDNKLYMEKQDELKSITSTALELRSDIYENAPQRIMGLVPGDAIESYTLKDIIEEGMFQFELQFENEDNEFNITLFTIEPDDYFAKIKKGVYIDHLHGVLFKREKKFVKKLIKKMNSF